MEACRPPQVVGQRPRPEAGRNGEAGEPKGLLPGVGHDGEHAGDWHTPFGRRAVGDECVWDEPSHDRPPVAGHELGTIGAPVAGEHSGGEPADPSVADGAGERGRAGDVREEHRSRSGRPRVCWLSRHRDLEEKSSKGRIVKGSSPRTRSSCTRFSISKPARAVAASEPDSLAGRRRGSGIGRSRSRPAGRDGTAGGDRGRHRLGDHPASAAPVPPRSA